MSDQNHNDKLEQFFKQHLENYQPEPSEDFWSRMEPVIPPKPSFWSSWRGYALKWLGAGLVVATVVWAGLTWWEDQQQLENLTQLVQQQQREIDQVRKEAAAQKRPESFDTNLKDTGKEDRSEVVSSGKANVSDRPGSATKNESSFFKSHSGQSVKVPLPSAMKGNTSQSGRLLTTGQDLFDNRTDLTEGKTGKHRMDGLQDSILTAGNNVQPNELLSGRSALAVPPAIERLALNHLVGTPHTLSVEQIPYKGFEPYPKFSFEAGASAFMAPVRRLFETDTVVYNTGSARISLSGGLLVNFEMNGFWMLQAGFQFKNMRAEKLSLQYNAFPLIIRRRWALGRHSRLEVKSGFVLNTLITARTQPENTVLERLETSYLGWQSGVGVGIPLSESMTWIGEMNLGYSLTPIANGKRSLEAGLYTGIRFSIR